MSTVPSDLQSELEAERAHLTESRTALAHMRARAETLFASGAKVAGDPFAAESLGRQLARRIAELADDPTAPLFFGRLNFGSDSVDHAGSEYHIGRRHVTDDRGEPLVLDWRAPLSRSFYQASVRDPQGVAVRRRFGWGYISGTADRAGSTHPAGEARLTSFEDENLSKGEELGTASKVLTSEIERPRVGPMRDIVATIQPEQDELVRADLEASICVQGAPGTGKTAVGLHRAAFLLYAYRERLRRAGVLIVGPNRAFLHYISAVLPALGEIDVTQSTVEDLIGTTATAIDAPATAAIKHDARMAGVLVRALHAHVARPIEPMEVSDGSYRWRISVDALRRIVDDVRREDPPYAIGRERVRSRVVGLLQRQSEARRADSPSDAWLRRMARSTPVVSFVDTVWPAMTPAALVFSLLSDPVALAAAAGDMLTEDEQALLIWAKVPRSLKSVKWSSADAVLIDEAAGLIERPGGFGHVVVDEAQDLSPMQCRVIARRSEHGSITLLGDLAQGTSPWAARDWRDSLAHMGKPDAPVVPLTMGFRVPASVLALANLLLPSLGVDVPPARSLRNDGELRVQRVDDLELATVAEVRAALAIEGSIGVIAPDADVDRLRKALESAGIEAGDADDDRRVSVLPATAAKGLEYDHVVVIEPTSIAEAEERGKSRLYVVLTRAVSRLTILHTLPLPAELT